MKYTYHQGVLKKASQSPKIVAAFLVAIALVIAMAAPTFAAKPATVPASHPKATGGVGYTAYTDVQRYADFNAHQTNSTCSVSWNVAGDWQFVFGVNDDVPTYVHEATLTQTGNSISGSGGYPTSGPAYSYGWTVTAGEVDGNDFSLTWVYTTENEAEDAVSVMEGTIDSNGELSGTWSDNYVPPNGSRTGTWNSVSGSAEKVVTGCDGKGQFNYSDASGYYYTVDVKYVKVSGDDAWFAGPVVSGNVGTGQWLFAKVHDGGTPGSNGDVISGSFTNMSTAQLGVATMATPADSGFLVTSGNLVVH